MMPLHWVRLPLNLSVSICNEWAVLLAFATDPIQEIYTVGPESSLSSWNIEGSKDRIALNGDLKWPPQVLI